MPRFFMIFLPLLAWTTAGLCAPIERPFLFEVTTKSGRVSHLFGTIHAGVSMREMRPEVTSTIKSARMILFEMMLNAEDSESFFSDPSPLLKRDRENSAPVLPENLRTELQSLGLPASVAAGLADADCYRAGRYRTKWAYPFLDIEIMRLVHREKIPAAELETREILKAADAEQVQTCSLKEISAQTGGLSAWMDKFDQDMAATIEIYKKGDAGTSFTSDEPAMRLRNFKWLPKLTEQIDQGRAVAVVGVAHLYGYAGLIELLRDRGYTVRRLTF